MRFHLILLATVFVLVTSTNTLASLEASAHPKTTTEPDVGDINTRQLRVTDEEERGILTGVKMAVKTTYWAQMQKSEDFVKKALKLDGLTKGAMKANPKYKYYQKYVYKAQGVEMDNWAFNEVNPTTIWNKLGLGTMSVAQREGSDALKIYARYARKYDSVVYHSGYKAYTPSTDAEMDVLLRVWAQADRSTDYVRKRLGIYSNVIVARSDYEKLDKFKSYKGQNLYQGL
ncbi:Secreted RxLR effector protein [Phytophthora ramorum]|nr:Secreted RxLR effector protein [Phytophthora ramorum]